MAMLPISVVVVSRFFTMVACHGGDSTATRLMRPSAWKVNSANFAFTEFSEVRTRLGPVASCLWWKVDPLREREGRQEEAVMPTYVVLMHWTDQGGRTVSGTVQRRDQSRRTRREYSSK